MTGPAQADVPMLAGATIAGERAVRHAFFTRKGGASEGIYAGLNTGFGSSDEAACVAENRRRAMAALGLDATALTTLYQVHGTTVHRVGAKPAAGPVKADAMVTDLPGRALGILTADCAPVLFADPGRGVVGAAHAGWRGALGGVVEATVAAMESLGASRGTIRAALGPAIGHASYEVGPEFPHPFLAADAANARFFAAAANPGKHRFDLRGFVLSRLAALDLASIDDVAHDTCAEDDMFFSYRRSVLRGESDYGRLLSAIALTG